MVPIGEFLHRKNVEAPRSRWSIMRILVLLLIVVALLGVGTGVFRQLTPARAASGDWPTYLHDTQRTGATTDTTLSTANAGQLTTNWVFKTGGPIAASPTVVGGTVYVGSWDGYEYALNAATGAMLWKTFLGQTTAPCYPQLAGVSSAADVENGVVYVGGGDSYWYALDATTGNVLWKVFIGDNTKGWYNWASPLIYNGYAYIGTSSLGDCPLVPGQLLQVSLTTHAVVNTFNFVPTGQYGGGIWTTPALDTATNTIFVSTGTRNQPGQTLSEAVVALDASTLALKSSWALPTSAETVDSDFASTPILFSDTNGNQLVTAINKNGIAYTLNRNNLTPGPVWSQQIDIGGSCPQCGDGSASSAAFGNNTLFLAGGNSVINGQGYKGSVSALDPATGNLKWQHGATGQVIPALAYSNGLVFDDAGATFEVLDAATGTRLYSYTTGNLLYAAPSISNGQVFTGGTDNNVYAFGLPSTVPPTPTPDPNCPTSWTCQDIGNPTPAGSESVSGTTWTTNGGGLGVSGTSDQYRFIEQSVGGDTQITAQVVSQTATGGSAQAGLMIRQTSDPTSPYYAIFLKPQNKLVVQYRLTFGGPTTTVTQAGGGSPPLYLEIQRVGDRFQAATSSDGVSYTLVPGDAVTIPMPATTLQGVALSGGTQGVQNTATFSAVTLGAPGTAPNPPASPSPCPSGWSCSDIGNPVTVGDQSLTSGTWTIQGAGNDISNNADQFHFAWQTLAADGTISAHIVTQTNTNAGAKAGVMVRQSTGADAAYYGAFVTPGKGILVQYRPTKGLKTQVITGSATTVPTYLMIARSGTTYCTYSSSDGTTWSYMIGTCFDLSLGSSPLIGLAVGSANTGTASVVTLDTVTLGTTAPTPPTVCPTGWTCADIGYPLPPGSQTKIGNTWTIQAGGNDIWGTLDQFRFVGQSLAADGSVSAHVISQISTNTWAKAGVMLRQSTDPAAPYYAIEATPANGIVVQYRAVQGGSAQQSAVIATGTVPAYLKVARSGNTYSAYTSTDGTTWTIVPGSSATLSTSGSVLAGMSVTSHDGSALSTVTFDTLTFSNTAPPPPGCVAGWTCQDVGAPLVSGTQSYSAGAWTIQGAGGDIWGASDQFHLVSQPLATDGSVSAHITSQTNTSVWAKAGVMLRQSSDPAAPYYAAYVTPTNGIVVQYRTTQGGNAQQSATVTGVVPTYLMVARSASTYTAYTSTDGFIWTPIAASSATITMTGAALAGLAVTSHNTGSLSAAVFDTVNISANLPCTGGWGCADIGAPAQAGSQSLSNGTWTIKAGGTDIGGVTDQFHFVAQSLAADGSVSARVVTETNTSSWAKAGVMLRQSSDPAAAYYFALVSPGNGIVVQYRTALGGKMQQKTALTGTVPAYLKVGRVGNTYTTYTSTDGVTWTSVAASTITITMSGSALAGMAFTSHNGPVLGTATFDTVNIGAGAPPPPSCPTGWSCADIGSPALAGSQSLTSGTWTLQAGGTDIGGVTDQFHFVSQSLPADGSVKARVVTETNTSSWAKAGVMLRQSSDPASAYYFAFVSPGNGIVIQYRTALGGKMQQKTGFAGTVPVYLAVARVGSTYTAYTSSDGVTWTPVAGTGVAITAMNGPVLGGLAFTSHNGPVLGTATFDTVSVGTPLP